MKKSFKVLILVLVMGIMCFASTACGKKDTSKVITFYHTMGDSLAAVLDTAIEEFEKKYPGWTVDASQIGGYDDVKSAIVADLQGQTQPNLAYCYSDHVAQYLTTKKVVDMSKFINDETEHEYVKYQYEMEDGEFKLDDEGNKIVKSKETKSLVVGYTQEEIADFVAGYYKEGLATNFSDYEKYGYSSTAMLTIPFVKSTELVYYNKTALVAAGIVDGEGKAKAPETWDELWADAAILKAKFPKCTPVGYDSEANWFITMCEQNGWGYTSAADPHYKFNDKASAEWLSKLNEYYDLGYVTSQTAYGSYTSNLFVKGQDEGVIFSIGSSGGASHQAPAANLFEWGVAPIPGSKIGETVVKKAISQGPSLCMFYEDCENSEEKALMTWLFVKEMLEPEFLASFSIASGYNPPRKSTFNIESYQEHLEKTTSITAVAAQVASTMTDSYFTSPAFVGSSTARTQVGNVLVYAMTGVKSASKALEDAYINCGGK